MTEPLTREQLERIALTSSNPTDVAAAFARLRRGSSTASPPPLTSERRAELEEIARTSNDPRAVRSAITALGR